MTDQTTREDGIARSFQNALNRHGHSFQYSLLKKISRLKNEGQSNWSQPVPEFPVDAGAKNSRVDFILRYRGGGLLLAAECKRVNPALGSWCFAKRPQYGLGPLENAYYIECFRKRHETVTVERIRSYGDQPRFHIGVEVKTNKVGESTGGSGRDAIEAACTQAVVALNGLALLLFSGESWWKGDTAVGLVPVIFTTADIWVTDADLSDATLETGNLNLESSTVKKVPWILFHYHQSPAMAHGLAQDRNELGRNRLGELLYEEFVRPIAIVSPGGLEPFLAWDAWESLRLELMSLLSKIDPARHT